ncbi:cytochrome P450 [Amycolatopsis sp. A133]|uniref:cytochrome P450 n=1 Tax=Amycolatopsis sp. A133 TaxID=3064472 RepID=UPI0027E727F3|nr:cytochrome P450 [Amycolatopsis sp. A133]MDQ7810946.1 cytochrome P450 [Amycolatopsis sp. A133]
MSSQPAGLDRTRLTPEQLGFDPEALREKYRAERDRRIRPDGAAQYRRAAGEFGYYATDPYTERSERAPVGDRVEAKREHPADDLLSGLIHGDAEPPLTGTELIDIATVLLGAGHETTANMLALATFALLEHPDQLAAVRADPTVLDDGVDELLRYLSIIHIGPTRIATEATTIAGTPIAAGDTVLLSVPQANRAQDQWPEPERLDLTRPRNPHLAFGHGVHQCLGQQLARSELRVGLAELIQRLPDLRLAAPADEIPVRSDMLIFGVHSLPITWS